MKKTSIILIIFCIIIGQVSFAEPLGTSSIEGEAGILIDYDTGQVLFDKNSDMPLYPASTTKMLTTIIILENHDLTEKVIIDAKSPFEGGKKIYVIEDEVLTVEQLLYATMVESANDAAAALAIYHAGSIEAFAEIMNAKAKEIGCTNSNFVNPNGLHDDNHYTTAHDLAKIAQYSLKNETFRLLASTSSYTIPPTEKQNIRNYIRNTNAFFGAKSAKKMLYRGENILIEYDIVDGVKTGYTNEARYCLVSSAQIDDQRYIAVVLKAPNEDQLYIDSRTLLDYGFENFYSYTFNTKGAYIDTVTLKNSDDITINVLANDSFVKMLDNSIDSSAITRSISVDPKLTTPIKENQQVGHIEYYYDNVQLGSVPIISEYDVSGETLLAETEFSIIKKDQNDEIDYKFYLDIAIKLIITFLIYRTIITIINIRKRRKRKS